MLERAAMDDGVVIVAALRSDRSVAELSTDPCARRRPGPPWPPAGAVPSELVLELSLGAISGTGEVI
jgi:hypothetical protein